MFVDPQEIGGAESRDIGDASIDEVRPARGPLTAVSGGGGKDLCLGFRGSVVKRCHQQLGLGGSTMVSSWEIAPHMKWPWHSHYHTVIFCCAE